MTNAISILFTGELLENCDRDQVMERFRARFGLKAAQVAQVFSGQAVTLKKGLTPDAARAYAKELAALGMRVRAKAPRPAAPPATSTDDTYCIVFDGTVADGFAREAVMLTAAHRLKFSDAQRDMLFSGREVTMKRGLAEDKARHYVDTLRSLGMLARTEPALPDPTPPARSQAEIDAEASMMETQFSPAPAYNFEETFHSSSTLEMLRDSGAASDPAQPNPPPSPASKPKAAPLGAAATVINADALEEYEQMLGEDEDPAIVALRAAHDPKPRPQPAPAAPPAPAAAPAERPNVQFDFTKSRAALTPAPEPAPPPAPTPAPPAERHTAAPSRDAETVLAMTDAPSATPPKASTEVSTNVVIAVLILTAAAIGAWFLL